MPGFLENVNVTIDNSNTPWEIVLNEGGGNVDDDVRQLPHMVTVQCSFKPILNILPRKESYSSPFVPLIVNKDDYLYLAPPAVRTNFVPELEPIQATPAATGGTIQPFTGYTPPPVQKLPPPTKENVKKLNQAKNKKGTRTTVTNANTEPIFKNTTQKTLTDTIGIGSAEGRRQAEIFKFRTNTNKF